MQWNPGAPTLLGNEWRPAIDPAAPPIYRIVAPSNAVAQRVDSTVTETVDKLKVYASADTIPGSFLAETFAAGNEVPGALTTTILRPSSIDSPGTFEPTNPATVLALLARADITGDLANYVGCGDTGGGPSSRVSILPHLRFPTVGAFTGRRILDVRAVFVVSDPLSEGIEIQLSLFTGFTPPGTFYPRQQWQDVVSAAFGPTLQTVVVTTGEMFPQSGLPWTQTDLNLLDTNGNAVQVQGVDPDSNVLRPWVHISNLNLDGPSSIRLYQVWLEVDHCAENRLTRDIVVPGAVGPRWTRFTPTRPDGTTPNLAKVNGTDLVTVLRQARYGTADKPTPTSADYTFSVPYLAGDNATPPPGLLHYGRPTLAPNGSVVDLGTPAGNATVGIDFEVAATSSVDAQTYIVVEPVALANGGPVAQQDVSGAIVDTYAGVIITAKVDETADAQTDLLTVRLRKRSDDSIVATASIDRATALTFAKGIGGWRTLQLPFAIPQLLAPATTYYLDLSQNRAAAGAFTLASFSALSGGAETQPGGQGGYGGITNKATYLSAARPAADLAAVVFIAYDSPTGFTALGDFVDVPTPTDCGPTGIPYVRLDWDPFLTGSQFGFYEIQRQDNYADWQSIGRLSDFSRGSFFDFEARMGVLSCYRMRAVSSVGLVSDWTGVACDTAPLVGCGYAFTSNVLNNQGTGLMVAYVDTTAAGIAERPVSFPEAGEVKRQAIYGRPMYVSFMPTERRGDEFTRKLFLSGLLAPATPPPGDADQLRDLSRTPNLPYVCVRDEHGGRWFANVTVPDYNQRNPGEFQHVTVGIGERLAVASNVLTA